MSGDAARPSTEADETEPEAPAKKRKKKKRKAEGAADRPDWWPAFALSFPKDEALDALVESFEKGNYAAVRAGVDRLLEERPARPDDVRSAARELKRRLDPDPIAIYLLAGAGLLLAFLALWYWTHAASLG
jgi:hypothetical protein